MLSKGYLVSKGITKENRNDYLKAFIIAGVYDVKRLEIIFSRSTKTMYKDIKRLKDELEYELVLKDKKLSCDELQNYINVVYNTLYSSVSLLSIKDRKEITKGVIDNLENNYEIEFFDDSPIVLKELPVKIGMKEKMIYLNQFYKEQSNHIFLNREKIVKFTKKLINSLNKAYEIIDSNELFNNLNEKILSNWIGYKYNILENIVLPQVSKYPQLILIINNFFKNNQLFINDYESSKLVDVIAKYIKLNIMKVNVLSDNITVIKIVQKQLSMQFENIKFVEYSECDVQVIPKDKEVVREQIETNVIFDDKDMEKLKEMFKVRT